jgi:hypothetical protein
MTCRTKNEKEEGIAIAILAGWLAAATRGWTLARLGSDILK